MKYILTVLLVLASCGVARAEQVRDHLKTVIIKKPYTVEVCQDRSNGSSDIENFITGAIIGGAIGNNVPGDGAFRWPQKFLLTSSPSSPRSNQDDGSIKN